MLHNPRELWMVGRWRREARNLEMAECGSASSGRERDNAWKAGEPRAQEPLYGVGKETCPASQPLPHLCILALRACWNARLPSAPETSIPPGTAFSMGLGEQNCTKLWAYCLHLPCWRTFRTQAGPASTSPMRRRKNVFP